MCHTGLIQDDTECKIAVESLRTTTEPNITKVATYENGSMELVETNQYYPKGCYLFVYKDAYDSVYEAYYNKATYGSTNPIARPVCRQRKYLQINYHLFSIL